MNQPQWEYRVISLGSSFKSVKDEELEFMLDEMGADHWEVVNIFNISNSGKVTVVAKRQISNPSRRA